ncbi:MAG TPA: hypothetical protein PL117_11305 [Accumulibacter sp.]|uniref:hypothetical protein n=1 Tax=Accumulibacter sp. TaxID=2053492 RepID=UPI000EE42370|nr:hypothetical protein [Accumulibacter sp.]HCZ14721.1 hypothetical protein [Accumulibacter sp.]HRD92262.1 hypothetical protein [Accumulibacter sp.]HRF73352.1 hypothetical protein [Accumulibacter sp.]
MKPLRIDFVERPPWCLPTSPRARATLIALATVLLLLGVALAWTALQLGRELEEASRAIAWTRQELFARTPPPPPPLVLSERQLLAINSAIGQLNTPWPAMLDGFESVATADIALLQIEPDNRRRLVKGVAEARDHQRMLDYLAALGSAAPFARAVVTKQEINEQDPNRPLRFAFEALLAEPAAPAATPAVIPARARDGQ